MSKVAVISQNKHQYSVNKMYKCLKISRQTYYTFLKKKTKPKVNIELEIAITRIFYDNKKAYGTRRIRIALHREGIQVSRKTISKIMRKHQLVSSYQTKKYRLHTSNVNNKTSENLVNQKFNHHDLHKTLVSDLTYVSVNNNWNYICVICDLYNREIVGYSCGKHKTADLVKDALMSMNIDFRKTKIFHTDRGREFDNQLISEVLTNNDIKYSLSKKGCPYDNAVSEATFKTIKTEFIYVNTFDTLVQLKQEFAAYVYWYNHIRMHSSLGYNSPVIFKNKNK